MWLGYYVRNETQPAASNTSVSNDFKDDSEVLRISDLPMFLSERACVRLFLLARAVHRPKKAMASTPSLIHSEMNYNSTHGHGLPMRPSRCIFDINAELIAIDSAIISTLNFEAYFLFLLYYYSHSNVSSNGQRRCDRPSAGTHRLAADIESQLQRRSTYTRRA